MRDLLIAILLLSTAGISCAGTPTGPDPNTPRKVTIVAMNDWHGALFEVPDPNEAGMAYGGLPWFVAAVKALTEPNPILIDGGDGFQGSWPINQSNGMGTIQAFSLLGVSAASVGNHEFDYGMGEPGAHARRGALLAAMDKAPYPYVAANIYHRKPDGSQGDRWMPPGVKPWHKITTPEGVHIGVIGLSTIETPTTTRSENVEDLVFEHPVETLRKLLPEVRSEVDVVVIAGHLSGACTPPGYLEIEEECMPNGEIGDILTQLPPGSVDVMVLGHEHTLLNQRIGDTYVLEARHKGHALNRVTLALGPSGIEHDKSTLHPVWALHHPSADPGCGDAPFPTEPILVGGRLLTPNPDAIELIQALEASAGSLCDRVACADAPYVTGRETESALGDLVADAMREAMPNATIALTNAGGLRADLPQGEIRREHIHGVMPFDNKLVLIELTGKELQLMLRIGTSGAHGLLQVSGVRIHMDPEATKGSDLNGNGQVETWEQNRLCSVRVDGARLKPKGTYSVVTTDFLLTGGDHLSPALKNAKILADGPTLRSAIEESLRKRKTCLPAPIPPEAGQARIHQGPCN